MSPMGEVSVNYRKILEDIDLKAYQCGRSSKEITLIAVTKNQPVQFIEEVYQNGCRNFGESKVQEALPKIPLLPGNCRWHFIGHLQSNKIAKVLSPFCLIHSVDSLELARRISELSEKKQQITPILLEVNTSLEMSKHGLQENDWRASLEKLNLLSHIRVEGLMTMAPFIKDRKVIRKCFKQLYRLRDEWQSTMKDPQVFKQLSMGMSHDYSIAIEEGATMLRIGSAIFSH